MTGGCDETTVNRAVRVLGFDTALGACSAAIVDGARVLAQESAVLRRGHAEALMPMIEAVRGAAGLAFADLDLLAVTIGPGTFTGLRVGLAAARGLALAAARPLVGITTLEALAAGAAAPTAVFVAIDARRGELYGQAFAADRTPLGRPAVLAVDRAARAVPPGPVAIIGSGTNQIMAALTAAGRDDARPAATPVDPDAVVVARLAQRRGPPADAGPVRPLYLRQPDAVPAAAPGRGR